MQISLSKRGMVEFDASAFSTKEEREMLYAITKLDVSYNSLSVVRGMQCLSNLTALDISFNKVKSLSGLPLKLRRLNVAHNELKYIDGLTPLSQLEWIDASYNELVSLGGLPGTQGLRFVDASHNRIGNLKGIELCTGIHELRVTHNLLRKVDDLIPLRYLRAIRELFVGDNPVTTNPRNFTAIRLLVPTIQHLEGAQAAAAAVSMSEIAQESSTINGSNFSAIQPLNMSNISRPKSPLNRTVTPNTSSIAATESRTSSPGRGQPRRDAPSSVSESFRRQNSSNVASTGHEPSLYQSLLKSLDPSRSQRSASAFTSNGRGTNNERSASADGGKANASPRRGLTVLSAANSTQNGSALDDSSLSKRRPSPGPHQIQDAANIGRALQDSSTCAIAAQRLLEQRIAELERDLKEAKKVASEAQRDAENYKLQVKQLKDTVERQTKVNAMLSDANRQLSIEASRLQLNAPKISIPANPSAATVGPSKRQSIGLGAVTTAASLQGSGLINAQELIGGVFQEGGRASTPEGNTNRVSPTGTPRLSSPKTSGMTGYAVKATSSPNRTSARGSISGGGKKVRRTDMSPKRGSMTSDVRVLIPQTGQPTFVLPASSSATHTPRDRVNTSNTGSKNVSFGGSQFYSPPQHYF